MEAFHYDNFSCMRFLFHFFWSYQQTRHHWWSFTRAHFPCFRLQIYAWAFLMTTCRWPHRVAMTEDSFSCSPYPSSCHPFIFLVCWSDHSQHAFSISLRIFIKNLLRITLLELSIRALRSLVAICDYEHVPASRTCIKECFVSSIYFQFTTTTTLIHIQRHTNILSVSLSGCFAEDN